MNYGKYVIGIRLLLLKEYFEANAGKNRLVTRKQLETFLENHDFQVEKKTLYSDINALKDYFGMKIEYDQRKKGYRLLNPPFEPHELRMLVDGIQSVEAYINPIPSGLVLTGIVVSVSVSALMLSLTIRLYKRYHTLDLDEISVRLRKEGL